MLLMSIPALSQGWKFDYNVSSVTTAGTSSVLPFWARTVQGGYMPDMASTLVIGGADFLYTSKQGITLGAGTNLVGGIESAGSASKSTVSGIVDRLYVSAGWKMLHADVGLKPRQKDFCSLSITGGGNIVMSGYARNLPGVNIWSDWIYFEKGHWVGVKGNFAHYQMMDNRYVKGTMVHNKSLSFKFALGRKVDLEAGLDHWVQWGGVSPERGALPASWMDYYRVIFARQGGDDAPDGDRQNALGNHLGSEYIRVSWRTPELKMSFQYDMPFEDGRGVVKGHNIPDGVYSLVFSFNDRKGIVTDVVCEYMQTTWQSGDQHDRPATEEEMTTVYPDRVDAYWQRPDDFYYGKIVIGGRDFYFYNGDYKSGWTYHGKVLGLPLMLPESPDENGIVKGIANNRVRAGHIGLKGNLGSIPYSFKATYSSNWGTYSTSEDSMYYSRPWQLSLAMELEFGRNITNLPLSFALGAYADYGKLYLNSVGLSLRVTCGNRLQ